jgi:hypothetical protein
MFLVVKAGTKHKGITYSKGDFFKVEEVPYTNKSELVKVVDKALRQGFYPKIRIKED